MANRDQHNDREGPQRIGRLTEPSEMFKKTSVAWCAEGALLKYFSRILEFPMAVTEASSNHCGFPAAMPQSSLNRTEAACRS
jgi:hypothetical protein